MVDETNKRSVINYILILLTLLLIISFELFLFLNKGSGIKVLVIGILLLLSLISIILINREKIKKIIVKYFLEKVANNRKTIFFLFTVIIFSIVIRIPALVYKPILTTDESIQPLMAKHIYEGREYPIFEYENWYSGSLKAHLSALVYLILGEDKIFYKIIIFLFYIGVIFVCFLFSYEIYGERTAIISIIIISCLPAYFMVSIDGMTNLMEVLFFGISIFYIIVLILDNKDPFEQKFFYSLLGLFSGLGLWCHLLFFVFLIPSILIILIKERFNIIKKKFLYFLIFFIAGVFPVILYNILSPYHESLKYIHWEATTSSPIRFDFIKRIESFYFSLKNLLILNFYEQPQQKFLAFSVHYFGKPSEKFSISSIFTKIHLYLLLMSFIYFTVFQILNFLKNKEFKWKNGLLLAFIILSILIYLLSAGPPASRHLSPLLFVIPIIYAFLIDEIFQRLKTLGAILLLLLLIPGLACDFNLTRNFVNHQKFWNGVINFLLCKQVYFVETDYWIAYKLTAISNERIIAESSLGPFKFPRYIKYLNVIRSANLKNRGYLIYSDDQDFKREVEKMLKEQNVKFRYKEHWGIGIFYHLSETRPFSNNSGLKIN